MKKNIKKCIVILFLFIIFFIINAKSYANQVSIDLSESFFRLHILANSDSEEDQNLKLKVRDKIIEYMQTIITTESTKAEIMQISQDNIETLKSIAQEVIFENGYTYSVEIEIGNYYFPTKYYGNISLPAGNYDALRIKIGNAEGQNWWCSLFPPLCFISISSGAIDEEGDAYLKNNLTDEEYSIITSSNPNINFKFKLLELFGDGVGT